MTKLEDRTELMRDLVRMLRTYGENVPSVADESAPQFFADLARELKTVQEKHGHENMAVKMLAAFYESLEVDAFFKYSETAKM